MSQVEKMPVKIIFPIDDFQEKDNKYDLLQFVSLKKEPIKIDEKIIETTLYLDKEVYLEGSVKEISSSVTSVVYKVRASSLAAYVVREVSIEGEHISAVDASDTIVVANETTEIGSDMSDTYVVTYTQGEVSEEETLKRRTDTVTNTMQSLIVNKTDLNNHPLKNAVFTLLSDDKESEVTGYESLISSESASGNLLNNIYLI